LISVVVGTGTLASFPRSQHWNSKSRIFRQGSAFELQGFLIAAPRREVYDEVEKWMSLCIFVERSTLRCVPLTRFSLQHENPPHRTVLARASSNCDKRAESPEAHACNSVSRSAHQLEIVLIP
jgi:hypothetical protein